jgi:hypothetical protein
VEWSRSWVGSRSSGTLSSKLLIVEPARKLLNPAEAPMPSTLCPLPYPLFTFAYWAVTGLSTVPWLACRWHTRQSRRCPSGSRSQFLNPCFRRHGSSNLGPYPTSFPSANGVQKKKKTRKQVPRLPYQQTMGSIAHLSPGEQIVQLRQSHKAIKSKLYSGIVRLQVGAPTSTTLIDTPMLTHDEA